MNPRVRKQWIPNCGGQSVGICNTYSNIPPKKMQLHKLPATWHGTDKSINHAPFKTVQLRLDKQPENGNRRSTRNGIAQHRLTKNSNTTVNIILVVQEELQHWPELEPQVQAHKSASLLDIVSSFTLYLIFLTFMFSHFFVFHILHFWSVIVHSFY